MKTIEGKQHPLAQFGELVLADHKLRHRLRATATQPEFVALAVQLGAERGCIFTAGMVETALREQRRVCLERWL